MFDPSLYSRLFPNGRDNVTAWVFEEISRRIIERKLPPGERITEESLVSELGASRTPVRVALKQLEELGLINRQRNRTLRVAPLHSDELTELVRLREYIEGLAASEVARRVAIGDADTAELQRVVMEIERAEEAPSSKERIEHIFELGTLFHASLVSLANMPRVERVHGGLLLALARYRLVNAQDKRRLIHRTSEHRRIVEAIESCDPAAAEAEMRAHIREGLRAYTTNHEDEMTHN